MFINFINFKFFITAYLCFDAAKVLLFFEIRKKNRSKLHKIGNFCFLNCTKSELLNS